MSRPHVEFVQSQALPWSPWPGGGWHDGADVKVMSRDAVTGAVSALVRYPAGWAAKPGHIDADEEVMVLSGGLGINDTALGEFCYAHFPAGFARHQACCAVETIVLTFLSCRPTYGARTDAPCDAARGVGKIDILSTPLATDFERLGVRRTAGTSISANTAAFLLLREDARTREQTWVLAARALRHGTAAEIHPVVEEMYLLGGEIIGPQGTMLPGAYFWRPPGLPHGPFGAKAGSLLFHRTIGGPLSTTYAQAPGPFDWHPPYRPILPPELEHCRGFPGQAPRPY